MQLPIPILPALVVLRWPGRMTALTLTIGVMRIISTAPLAVLLTVAIVYGSRVGSRYVLPVADRLERQLADRRPA